MEKRDKKLRLPRWNAAGQEQLRPFLKELFPSAEMASYLTKCFLKPWQIRDMIAYAAIPLERKRDMFLQLAAGKDDSHFGRQADSIARAIQETRLKPGEFFYLKSHSYFDEDTPDEERGLEPYLSWAHILERIQEYLGYLDADEREWTWFQVEKWSPDGNGRLKNDYDYIVFGSEVCYFTHNTSSGLGRCGFSMYHDLNLPVPFRAGDIVTIDCRPFAPVSHVVILEAGDNLDCCCLQAMYRKGGDAWAAGAVKHGHASRNPLWFSPLYRLATFHGELPEEERLLEKVSRYVNGDEALGSALWNYISDLKDKEREERPVLRCAVTEAQILSYIERR